jgi:DNA-binding response OmpR family regulator
MISRRSTDLPTDISDPQGTLRRGPGYLGQVLLADDNPAVLAALATVMRRAGLRVRVARTGRQAVRQVRVDPLDLVVTDIVMPDMDGLDLLRWLRRMQPAVPAIALSGGGPDAGALYAKAALCLGADLVLAKPAQPSVVLAAAHRLIGRPGAVATPAETSAPAA